MKHVKRLLSLLLAVVMTVTLGLSGFAADATAGETTGTITIHKASKGNLYEVYKIFDAEYNAQNPEAVRYRMPSGAPALGTNEFFQVDDEGYVTVLPAAESAGGLSEKAVNFLNGYVSKNKLNPADYKSGDGGDVVFDGLDFGYYVVMAYGHTTGATMVTTTHPNAEVNDKVVETPKWHEDDPYGEDGAKGKYILESNEYGPVHVEETDAKIGESVSFEIAIDTTNYAPVDYSENAEVKKIDSYHISDNLKWANMYATDIIQVYVGDQLLEEWEYECHKKYDNELNLTGFSIDVPWLDEDGKSKYENGAVLYVRFDARLHEGAQIAGDGNENTAEFYYTFDDGSNSEVDSDKAKVNTYAMALVKVDGTTGAPLEGATFQLPFEVKKIKSKDDNDTYVVADYSTGEEEPTNTVTTPKSGKILILGVDTDVDYDGNKYTIEEITAPDGYNKVKDPFEMDIEKTNATTTDKTLFYLDENGNITDKVTDHPVKYVNENYAATVITVKNMAGSVLPSTGGMGTKVIYILGAILALGAGLALVVRKRMKGQNT